MTTYREVPVNERDLEYVIENLWDRGREELERLGLSPLAAFRSTLAWVAGFGRSGTLLADDVPVLVAGIAFDDVGAFTWFLATDDAQRHMRQITRVLRREVKAWGAPLRIRSASAHPDAQRWFKVLGFEHERDVGVVRIFRRD